MARKHWQLRRLGRRSSKRLWWINNFPFLIEKDHLGDWSPEKDCCCYKGSNHPDDLFLSRYLTPGFKPFSDIPFVPPFRLLKMIEMRSIHRSHRSRQPQKFNWHLNSTHLPPIKLFSYQKRHWVCIIFYTIMYNYPPKGRWIVVDIYRDAKQ